MTSGPKRSIVSRIAVKMPKVREPASSSSGAAPPHASKPSKPSRWIFSGSFASGRRERSSLASSPARYSRGMSS